MIALASLLILLAPPPTITVTADNISIKQSCTIEIAKDAVIADADNNGVIHIDADDITMTFPDGVELWGCDRKIPGDQKRGIGIALNGHKNVTIRDARVHGFKIGLRAENVDAMKIDGGDFSDNFRQHLRSTPKKEDQRDWMSFHHNDKDEAVEQYGAAIYIKNAGRSIVHNVLVRRGQNGIVLSRVMQSYIYDNDCSYLSGWGLAMWRSTANLVSRNAFDFCIRGYSDGVYNRGQDSAGIIVFEQCVGNTFAENSATHCGDGFFSFAGLEALNGEGAPKDFNFKGAGCNGITLIGNDFSDAAAHGIEVTFSFAIQIRMNRIHNNAICGIWGGFSQQMVIEDNEIADNGAMGYGLERGGVNIDHSADNRIEHNRFSNNACGVHLWWHPAKEIQDSPWGKANYRHVDHTDIVDNIFEVNDKQIGIQLRDLGKVPGENVTHVNIAGNEMKLSPGAIERDVTHGITIDSLPIEARGDIHHEAIGLRHPVGAHPELRGRDKIVIDEWGPTIKP